MSGAPPPQHPLRPQDVELGRLAIAWGWLRQADAARLSQGAGSFPQRLLAAGLLNAEQVRALEAAVVSASGRLAEQAPTAFLAPPVAQAATAYHPPPLDPEGATHVGPPSGGAPVDPQAATAFTPAPGPHESGRVGLPAPGEVVAGYRIDALLGQGGMGAVFRATDAAGKPVALKFVIPGRDSSGLLALRFQREAEAMGRIGRVPGVVPVHGAGSHRGCAYLAMGLIEGQDLLAQVKDQGPPPVEDALELVAAVAEAIEGCHQAGVLHRDLKPANVLVRAEDGKPFVTDFGLALIDGEGSEVERLTQTGELMGTPAFMPPEQADGDKARIGPLSDVYALGALLYYLVTGRAPFQGTHLQVLHQLFKKEPPSLSQARGRPVPADLQAIASRALAKDPRARYPSARALAEDLRRLRRGEPIEARAPTRWERFRWRLARKDPQAVGSLVVGAAALITLPALALLAVRPSPDEALRTWVAAFPAELEARVLAPGAAKARLDLDALGALAASGWSRGQAVSPDPELDGAAPLAHRLRRLRERLVARTPPIPGAADALGALEVGLELEAPTPDARPLSASWTFGREGAAADLLAALAQLGYGLDPERCSRDALTRLPASSDAARAALAALAAGDPPLAAHARRLAAHVAGLENAAAQQVEAELEGTVTDTSRDPWGALTRAHRYATRAEDLERALDALLQGELPELLEHPERLVRAYRALERSGLPPAEAEGVARRISAYLASQADAAKHADLEALQRFAQAYAVSWGRHAPAPFGFVSEVRAILVQRLLRHERLSMDLILVPLQLGYGYGDMVHQIGAQYLPELEATPRARRSGDLHLLWAFLLELDRRRQESDRPRTAAHFALALAEHLDADVLERVLPFLELSPDDLLELASHAVQVEAADRERLFGAQAPAPSPRASPLSPVWLDDARERLLHHAFAVAIERCEAEERVGDPRRVGQLLDQAVAVLEPLHALITELVRDGRDPGLTLKRIVDASGAARFVLLRLPRVHGLRDVYVARLLPLFARAPAIEASLIARLETNARTGEVGVTEELWTSTASIPAVVRAVSHLVSEELKLLELYGLQPEGLARALPRFRRLADAFPGHFPYVLGGRVWYVARALSADAVAREVAPRIAQADLPQDADDLPDALALRDEVRGWLAGETLDEDPAAARALLEASLAEGQAAPGAWPDALLDALGTSRAEVDARRADGE
ncbi:MAG: serine/threonine-protein kinase [Planctomycetota bacterium]